MRATGLLLALGMAAAASAAPVADAYRGADPGLLAQVRAEFAEAPGSPAATERLRRRLAEALPAETAAWPPVFQAYRAALEGLSGKHSLKPWDKYRRAKAGLALFHGLPEAHPGSTEIRMLRYSFCRQLPDFFEAAPQAEADLAVLAELLERGTDPMVDDAYRRDCIRWILRNGATPPAVRPRLEAALAAAEAKIRLSPAPGGE